MLEGKRPRFGALTAIEVGRTLLNVDWTVRGAEMMPSRGGPRSEPLVTIAFVGIGAREADPSPVGAVTAPLELLAGSSPTEVWSTGGPVAIGRDRRVQIASDGHHLFAALAADGAGGVGLEATVAAAYHEILLAARNAGYPHLLRMWNFVPGINDDSLGIERYKLFCRARSDAYAAHFGTAAVDHAPAATAVGCRGERFVVHLLASKNPGSHLENPRQISAHQYPERYGPRRPSFARATIAPPSAGHVLLISGTASIVGHESLHPGDPAAQTEETMRNIESLVDAAGVAGRGEPLGRRLESLRVYVARRADLDSIRRTLEGCLRARVPTIYVEANVCRAELLVEIEGVASPPREGLHGSSSNLD